MVAELQSREASCPILAYSTGGGLVASQQRKYHCLHLVTSSLTALLGELPWSYFNPIPKGLAEIQPLEVTNILGTGDLD